MRASYRSGQPAPEHLIVLWPSILSVMLMLLAASLIVVDQLTKYWAAQSFSAGGSQALGLGFSFTYVQNTGAAFGIFRGLRFQIGSFMVDGTVLLGVLSAAVTLGLVIYLLRSGRQQSRLLRVSLTLILAGAAGNMIDRFLHRYVIDFIHFQQGNFNFPVFNVADACVVIGAGLLLIQGFMREDPEAAEKEETVTVQRSSSR